MKKKSLILGFMVMFITLNGNDVIASTDVSSSHWARSSIEEMQSKSIMNGYPDGAFKPDNYITREEVSKTIYSFAKSVNPKTTDDIKETEISLFPDVEPDTWSLGYINWMYNTQLSNGYPDGSYKPTNNISRAEFSAIMSKYLTSNGEKWSDTNMTFNDTESNWANIYISQMSGLNYIRGYSDGNFKPDNSITRAEVSVILERIINSENNIVDPIDPPNENETESQKNAIKKASELITFSSYSKVELAELLNYYGFSSSDSLYAVETINVSWKSQALKMANSYLDSGSFSKTKLAEQLEYKKFESSEVSYAVNNVTVNWNQQALKKANSYLETSAFSKEGLISQLKYEEFLNSEIDYAMNNIVADWNQQSLKKVNSYLAISYFSREGLISQLQYEKFLNSEIDYAMNNINVDWNQQALKKAEEYLSHDAFTKEEMIDQLLYEGFTESETDYAVDTLALK